MSTKNALTDPVRLRLYYMILPRLTKPPKSQMHLKSILSDFDGISPRLDLQCQGQGWGKMSTCVHVPRWNRYILAIESGTAVPIITITLHNIARPLILIEYWQIRTCFTRCTWPWYRHDNAYTVSYSLRGCFGMLCTIGKHLKNHLLSWKETDQCSRIPLVWLEA